MNISQKNTLNDTSQLSDLILLLKTNIENNLNTATLGFFNKVIQPFDLTKRYQLINVKPFPILTSDILEINAYCFSNSKFEANEKVLLIFTDNNFITNLTSNTPKIIASTKKHLTQYAVVIKLNNDDLEKRVTDLEKKVNDLLTKIN